MKNMVKKNQIMITALAIMIAVAGYLNFAGTKMTEEDIMTSAADAVVAGQTVTEEDAGVAALFEISDEDMEQAALSDIESMDSEVVLDSENYLDEAMAENAAETAAENISGQLSDSETPGEAVFTSTPGMDTLSGAKLLKEQTRAKNKETLLELINNVNITEEQKQEAIDNMIAITDIAEKETASEILLEAKGFQDVVVSITDGMVDVVVNAAELTEAQRAQIEDIVIRKTGVGAESIVISTVTNE